MKIDQNTVLRFAELARLELSEEEKSEFTEQLSGIIEYIDKIRELDTENIKPTDHIVDLKNVFKMDIVADSLKKTDIEKMAPQHRDGYIVVPKIIDG